MQVRVEGLNKFVREAKKVDKSLAADMKKAHDEAAKVVAKEAQTTAPRKTGRLARSVRGSSTQRAGVVRAGNARVPYAGPVHFGWPARNIKPQPFLYDALDRRREDVIEIFNERVDQIMHALHNPSGRD